MNATDAPTTRPSPLRLRMQRLSLQRLSPLWSSPLRRAWLIVGMLAVAVIMPATLVGLNNELRIAGLVVAVSNGSYGLRLLYVAACRRATALPTGAPRPGAYHSIGWFGAALIATAVAGGMVALRSVRGESSTASAHIVLSALFVASGALLLALLLLPGTAHSMVARLRRGFDGLSVGICLLFTAWVLMISPRGTVSGLGFWVTLLTCSTLSVAVGVGLCGAGIGRGAGIHRELRGAWACAGCAALSATGLCGLSLSLATRAHEVVPALFAVLLAAAPVVVSLGIRSAEGLGTEGLPAEGLTTEGLATEGLATEGEKPDTEAFHRTEPFHRTGARHSAHPPREGTFAHHPVLALPVAVAIAVALHHLVVGAPLDVPSVALGLVGVAAVAIRETLAALDVSRYARMVTEQAEQFRNLVAGSTDVIMVLDDGLVVRWLSPAAARQFGLTDAAVVGRHFELLIHPEDAAQVAERLAGVKLAGVKAAGARATGAKTAGTKAAGANPGVRAGGPPVLFEARLRDGCGQWRETESSANDQRHVREVGGIVVHVRDVGERKEMERALRRLAFADLLTGLANRRQLHLSIVEQRRAPRVQGALLHLKLDGFSDVTDVWGHDVGDAVLVEVASRLRAGVVETDLPARLTHDEFAVLTEVGPVRAYALANQLIAALTEPIAVTGPATVQLAVSVGLTDLAGAAHGEDVLRRAALALRRATQLGRGRVDRGRVEWYDEAVELAVRRRVTLEQDLPGALGRGELDLIYQPILSLVEPRPLGVEALLRWRHPSLGTLLPADVIPVAEELGLIAEIGCWVLHQAVRQLAAWLRDGRDLSMAVNVSPRQLDGPDLVAEVAAVLERYALPPDRLVLELAEGGLGRCTQVGTVRERLVELRRLGVRTALDEFGAGPQSLSHLHRLPMDMVKIGRPFFDDTLEQSGQPLPIIDVMVGLGRRLGIDVIAQGLEAPAHLTVVRGAGCRMGQGHLFAHPQPVERIEAYLDGFPTR